MPAAVHQVVTLAVARTTAAQVRNRKPKIMSRRRLTTQFLSRLGVAMLAMGHMYVLPSVAEACGGFFCSQSQPVNQAAERILFADNGDGTITAVIQIMYEGPSENFSWLLPISSVPEGDEIAVASDLAFQRLQQATNPQYNLTTRVEGNCRGLDDDNGLDSVNLSAPSPPSDGSTFDQSSGVTIAASGVVGSFEWTVLELDATLTSPADAALDWLTDNNYDVTPDSAELIGPYLEEGRYLLALRLTKGSDSGSIRPLVLTYDAELPDIPIKLTAVAANEDMGVMAWVAAKERSIPFNYNALELNEARINWFNASANYNDVVIAAANEAGGGQGFVTEYAQPSELLAEVVWSSFEEQDWQDFKARLPDSEMEFSANSQQFFEFSYFQYAGYDGFWDAVRATVSLPEDTTFEELQDCPSCFELELDLPTYVAALDKNVVAPMQAFQELLDTQPYLTRFYSTLSAAEMTVDPVFAYNPDLDDVDNIHRATRVIECASDIYESDANWRIDLPQGGVIRGTPTSAGTWPTAVTKQASNFRILQLSTSGAGEVLEDNAEAISSGLSDYNATVPDPIRSSGWCSLAKTPGSQSGTPTFWFALTAIGVATMRRRLQKP